MLILPVAVFRRSHSFDPPSTSHSNTRTALTKETRGSWLEEKGGPPFGV